MTLKRRSPKSTSYQKFCYCVEEYLARSTIHGLNHIGNKSTHVIEKVFWAMLVAVAIYGGCVLSSVTLNRYYTNPIVISIERDRFSWTTSLPAVTICPVKRINETVLDDYLEKITSKNKTFLKEFIVSLAYANYTNLEDVLENDEIQPKDYMSILQKIKLTFTPEITVSGPILNATEWFFDTITEFGLCYNFNSPLAVYSSYKYWKSNKWKIVPQLSNFEVHPLDEEGFSSISNIHDDYKAYFHGPYEVVDIRSKPTYVSKIDFLNIYLTAISIVTSEATKHLSVTQRKCRYYYESNLRHYPVYTSVNCRMECRITLAKQLCGCVPHFYRTFERIILLRDECNCTANCEEVNYIMQEKEVRQINFRTSLLQYGIKKFPEMRLKRDVIFGISDVVVYIGGVMGLFLGFSILSTIEFIYFFTLRCFWFLGTLAYPCLKLTLKLEKTINAQ